ncbi:hypothetical protein JCM1841_002916 [Sporobolomyces salmonicolor]
MPEASQPRRSARQSRPPSSDPLEGHSYAFTMSKHHRAPSARSDAPAPAKALRRLPSVASEGGEDSGEVDKGEKNIKWGNEREQAALTFIEENDAVRTVLGGGAGVSEAKGAMRVAT